MKFDEHAKVKTVSSVIQLVKWAIWGVTGLVVGVMALAYPQEDPEGRYLMIIVLIAIAGGYAGHFVEKYHDSIIQR